MSTVYSGSPPPYSSTCFQTENQPNTPDSTSSGTLSRITSFSSAHSSLPYTEGTSPGPRYSQWTSHGDTLPTFIVNGTGDNNSTNTYSPTASIASTGHLSPGLNSQSETLSEPSSSAMPTPTSTHSFFGTCGKSKHRPSKAEISELKTNCLYQTSRLDTATAVHTQVSKHAKAGTWLGFNINTPYDARKEISTLAVSMAFAHKKEVEDKTRESLVAYSDANGTHSLFTNAASHFGRRLKTGFKEDSSVEPSVRNFFNKAESEVMGRYSEAACKAQDNM